MQLCNQLITQCIKPCGHRPAVSVNIIHQNELNILSQCVSVTEAIADECQFFCWGTQMVESEFGSNSMNLSNLFDHVLHGHNLPSNVYLQHENAPCHKAIAVSNWFHDTRTRKWVLSSTTSLQCGRTWDSQHEHAPEKSVGAVRYYHVNNPVNMDHLKGMLWNQCHEQLRLV